MHDERRTTYDGQPTMAIAHLEHFVLRWAKNGSNKWTHLYYILLINHPSCYYLILSFNIIFSVFSSFRNLGVIFRDKCHAVDHLVQLPIKFCMNFVPMSQFQRVISYFMLTKVQKMHPGEITAILCHFRLRDSHQPNDSTLESDLTDRLTSMRNNCLVLYTRENLITWDLTLIYVLFWCAVILYENA